MYGVGAGKLIIIISDHGQEVADKIANAIDRGSTLIRAIGTYTGSERQVLRARAINLRRLKVGSAGT